jgi:hypothetical protein
LSLVFWVSLKVIQSTSSVCELLVFRSTLQKKAPLSVAR